MQIDQSSNVLNFRASRSDSARSRRGIFEMSIMLAAFGSVLLLFSSCTRDDGGDSNAAEQAYIECADDHGIDVEDVRITPNDFDIVLSDDAPPGAEDVLFNECEPLAMVRLEGDSDDGLTDVPDGIETVSDYFAYLEDDDFSGVVLVSKDGEQSKVFERGWADADERIENTIHTAFDSSSISKMFTAVAILQLVDEGQVTLDDTLDDLMDDVPDDKQEITVRQLLDFTSGLGEFHDTEGDFEPMDRNQAWRAIVDQDLLFEPGSDEAYSNSSYTLAALLVEVVTGRDFTEVVKDLFAEVGLAETDFYGGENLQEINVATGHDAETNRANNPADWEATWALLGSGGIASTPADLLTWWESLIHNQTVLQPETTEFLLEEIHATVVVGGMELRGAAGTNDFGFDAMIVDLVERDTTLVVVSNANPPELTLAGDAGLILAQLLHSEPDAGKR
jgi:CubicO group peptidase (beta-lactamase class C family)